MRPRLSTRIILELNFPAIRGKNLIFTRGLMLFHYFFFLIFLLSLFCSITHAQTITYEYDENSSTNGKGRMTSVTDLSGTTKLYYDITGREVQTDKVVDGNSYSIRNTYDSLGRIVSIQYPDVTTVNYVYNGPWLDRVYEGSTDYIKYTGYNALGQAGSLIYNNAVIADYYYADDFPYACQNKTFVLCTLKIHAGSTIYQSLSYGHDQVGNITQVSDDVNGVQYFYYDELNRLISTTGPYGANNTAATISYGYDQIGNMTCNSRVSTCSVSTPNYFYPASGSTSMRPHAVITAGPNNYVYDANGNMIGGAGRTITYDPENRPASITTPTGTTTFIYDGNGRRVKKTIGGSTTVYIGKLYECAAVGTCSKYIFAEGKKIAIKPTGTTGEIYYYHNDNLGSTSVITDKNGAKVQSLLYYPFGETRSNTGSIDVRHKYTSQELDDSTGLYFYNARYYEPVLARFISPDSIIQSRKSSQFLNRYSYAMNNPVRYVDPTGHSIPSCSYGNTCTTNTGSLSNGGGSSGSFGCPPNCGPGASSTIPGFGSNSGNNCPGCNTPGPFCFSCPGIGGGAGGSSSGSSSTGPLLAQGPGQIPPIPMGNPSAVELMRSLGDLPGQTIDNMNLNSEDPLIQQAFENQRRRQELTEAIARGIPSGSSVDAIEVFDQSGNLITIRPDRDPELRNLTVSDSSIQNPMSPIGREERTTIDGIGGSPSLSPLPSLVPDVIECHPCPGDEAIGTSPFAN